MEKVLLTAILIFCLLLVHAHGRFSYAQDGRVGKTMAGNQDCITKKPICSTASFDDNNGGSGTVNDLTPVTRGCLGVSDNIPEHQSSWYYFRVATGGTFNFLLNTVAGADDYDFAVWGPNPNCPPTTAPIRCNYSLTPGLTGLSPAALNNSEPAGGSPFSKEMNVLAGQIYIIMIDNFSASNQGFEISFSGTATLDCSILAVPLDLTSFSANIAGRSVELQWSSVGENSYFAVERSLDGIAFENVSTYVAAVPGQNHIYRLTDINPQAGVLYYRLKTVGLNGSIHYSRAVPVSISSVRRELTGLYPNPLSMLNPLLNISYTMSRKGLVSFRVCDATGTNVYQSENNMEEGPNNFTIDSRLWQPGIYFLEIRENGEVIRRKIQVIK